MLSLGITEAQETTWGIRIPCLGFHFGGLKKAPFKTKILQKLLQITNQMKQISLCEKCPNTEWFLVLIFLYSDWIWISGIVKAHISIFYFAKLVALYPNNWNQKIIYHKCFEIYQTCYKNVSGIVNLLW